VIDELPCDARALAECLVDARERVLATLSDLSDEELLPPLSPIVNPFLWELGHVIWFQEYWTLRHLGAERPMLGVADALYDSAAVAHDTRWQISLRDRMGTLAYASGVLRAFSIVWLESPRRTRALFPPPGPSTRTCTPRRSCTCGRLSVIRGRTRWLATTPNTRLHVPR
jgi:hypothetical protein